MREIKKYRYFFAAVLTVAIFVLGILMSSFVDQARYDSLRTQIRENNVELESRQLQLNYLQSDNIDSCRAMKAGLQDIVSGYNKRLSNLQNYAENSMFNREEFRVLKHSYILSGIRYWMFAQELRQRCGYKANTVLFFTSSMGNNGGCSECGRMGEQLSLLKSRYEERLLVFTVPVKLNDGMIDMLESQYNVTEIPTVVINSNKSKRIEGFESRRKIEEYLTVEPPQ
ncbi:MAG: hypothetical protein ABEJ36_01535 [Candidatus Nanosalina sp.]